MWLVVLLISVISVFFECGFVFGFLSGICFRIFFVIL